ncbi:MAG: XRE family transcriptional regulator [Anaerolineales bacterium]|nr:XRE family transcriptional regulator [Anaerolineales bacterium]
MKFQDWLREIRSERGLELSQISNGSGLTISLLSRIENGLTRVTLSSTVCICHALGVSLLDLVKSLEFQGSLSMCRKVPEVSSSPDTFVLADVERFLTLYATHPAVARDLLTEGLEGLLGSEAIHQEGGREKQLRDLVNLSMQSDVHLQSSLIPYPPDAPATEVLIAFGEGGILIPADIGAYARGARTMRGLNLPLREVSARTGISRSALSRLEIGVTGRILLDDMIALDRFLDTDGELFSIAWAAGEFQTGVSRKKYRGMDSVCSLRWTPEEYQVANTLIRTLRWQYLDQEFRFDWVGRVRAELDHRLGPSRLF